MIGLIVTGHGSFATGITSSMELIAGRQEEFLAIDFTAEDTVETLEAKLLEGVNKLGDEIIVLSDLAGGSPFKVSALLSQKVTNKNIQVVAGTNLAMLLEVSLCREGIPVESLRDFALNSGVEAVKAFEIKVKEIEVDFEDGI